MPPRQSLADRIGLALLIAGVALFLVAVGFHVFVFPAAS